MLATRTWGAGPPPLVLLHGWIGSTADWELVAAGLADDRQVLAYDHRGHGQSPHTKDYTFAALVDDLEAWLDEQGLEAVDLVGHSMGGVVAMQFALRRPERVRSLVLVDTGAAPAGPMPLEILEGLTDLGRTAGMGAVRDALQPMTAGALDYTPPRPRDLSRGGAGLLTMDPDAFLDFARELNDYPSFLTELASLTCRTTVVVGEHDTALIPGCEAIAATVPGARLVRMSACGHSPQEDDPDTFVAVVRAHLTA